MFNCNHSRNNGSDCDCSGCLLNLLYKENESNSTKEKNKAIIYWTIFLDCCLFPFCCNSFDLHCNDHQTCSIYSFCSLIPNYTSNMKQEKLFDASEKRYKVAFSKATKENLLLRERLKRQQNQIKYLKRKEKQKSFRSRIADLFKPKKKKFESRPLRDPTIQRQFIAMIESWYSITEIWRIFWVNRHNALRFIRRHSLQSIVKNRN